MANELDETKDPIREEGRDVHVIDKQLTVTVDWRSTFFQVILWILGIIPGIVFAVMKIKARSHLQQMQQKIQHDASTIDNYLQNRVTILTNTASLLNKSIELDVCGNRQISQRKFLRCRTWRSREQTRCG